MLLIFDPEDAIQTKGIKSRSQTVGEHTFGGGTKQIHISPGAGTKAVSRDASPGVKLTTQSIKRSNH